MQKTIYISNKEVWEDIRREAGLLNLSVSAYLVFLHNDRMNFSGSNKDAQPGKFKSHEPTLPIKLKPNQVVEATPLKSEVIKEARSKINGILGKGDYTPYPKSKQVGKK